MNPYLQIAKQVELESARPKSEPRTPTFAHVANALHIDTTTAIQAFNGSLDAARKMHETCCPDWTRSVDATVPEAGIRVQLHHKTKGEYMDDPYPAGDCENEAHAWIAAMLRAKAWTQPVLPKDQTSVERTDD